MGEKEKTFLGFLGLIISIIIFCIVIFNTIDSDSIKVNTLSGKMIDYLCQNKYEEFYENLSCDEFPDLNKFIIYQENMKQILGNIKSYRSIGIYKNNSLDEKNSFSAAYDINFENFSDKKVRMILTFKCMNNKWQVSKYKIESENQNDNIELRNDIKYINMSIKDDNKEISDVRKMALDIIEKYNNGEYKYIYSILDYELKKKGNEDEFLKYLEKQNNTYGKISNIKFDRGEVGKDKSEYKLDYHYIEEKTNKKIYLTFWIRNKDKLYLSGINFSENVW
ncbi:hypothetical protein B0P06_000453 [Clostridium saccharoperbutylacetonicum]|uniref:Uncharacterized protein n=1 Tax=Clostridium saccharoperbutylacetonicum N1-4(HMT) TaxID=931276 RepID=M1MGH5_9CLOT|nr:hypothetical protein [Clostridium saccharoperbutylacetonicum]AGF55453.1 hypothetical protein Cspa_c16830 [Clostridium saccharoperbutylacetonicum N1-4(HMT)]NRT63832.1 hypothetical protein [Clostridium saccharoperbutylacetonicum]NSB27195.1 hypothetical protein [Clostridium saccharoperbutylacetonicum]NSB40682.1 hypothetical protein [Clostridium saccharoperbutylacetonicum]